MAPRPDLFERALAEQPADIDEWLAREAPDDPDVREEVRSLLQNDRHAGRFLIDPVADRFPALLDDKPSYEPGQIIGP